MTTKIKSTEVKETIEEKEITEVPQKVEQKEEKETKKTYVYLGPNIKKGLLNTGKICNEIPIELKELIKKVPTIEKLFVEVKEVPSFKKQLKNQSSVAFINYHRVLKELEGVE